MSSIRLLANFAVFVSMACVAACGKGDASSRQPAVVRVFVAASANDVLEAAATEFERTHDVNVEVSAAASSTLARQITEGAPFDLFLSADQAWMDTVQMAGRIENASRTDLVSNRLVIVKPKRDSSAAHASSQNVAAALKGVTRLALADPAHVPAGKAARAMLESLSLWTTLEPMVIAAADVRAALRLVELDEADAGIVYATDARASRGVIVVAEVSPSLHPPILYPIALAPGASTEARAFFEWLRGPEGFKLWSNAGFEVVPDMGR